MAENRKSMQDALKKANFPVEIEEEVNICGPGSSKAGQYIVTGWPEPHKRYRLIWEDYNISMEEPYFWMYNHIQHDQGYVNITKITDTLTSGEMSSTFGAQAQRLNIQQDKASQYMGTIAQMVKNLFQIVREIRIIKERLEHYHGSQNGDKSADIALKGYWVDLVQGGGKNPASIYGLASQLGFATLPDLFFNTMVMDGDDVEAAVEKQFGEFNKKVKEVLKRNLKQYVVWRKNTQEELETRHRFTLRYLRQHWNTIKMYMSWIKPMLRNIRRLQNFEKYRDHPELLSSVEGAMSEVEFLAYKEDSPGGYHPVILAHFMLRTQPQMPFNNEYQRGPLHMGRIVMTLRAYTWTKEEIAAYEKLRNEEDFELLGLVNGSVEAAMDALGDDLRNYLEQAEEDMGEKKPAVKIDDKIVRVKGPSVFEPISAVYGGFKDMVLLIAPGLAIEKEIAKTSGNNSEAKGMAIGALFQTYKNFKKGHGMMQW